MSDWSRVRELFERAAEVEPSKRDAWLRAECASDEELLGRVRALLDAEPLEEGADGASPLDAGLPAALLEDLDEGPAGAALVGRTVGGFRITDTLGEGGMGVVLRAEQDRPRREVALKVLAGALVTESMRRRFTYEGEVLGRLRHPHIAQVFATGGEPDPVTGRPLLWIAMELIPGARTLDRHVAEVDTDRAGRLQRFLQVCDAVEHGHRQGVLHRDLKPGNVLVSADGQLKVIDFGIARSLDQDAGGNTLTGQVLGTPRYMSPEQLAGDGRSIDTRSDVFALGVLLFRLLTDREPRDAEDRSFESFLRTVLEEEPPRPSSVAPVEEDLDWICLRAMAREPGDRYGSVGELAADVRRFGRSEPVSAGPPSRVYALRRFVRRNRALVGTACAGVVALVAGTVVSTLGWMSAARSGELARAEAATQATVVDWLTELLQSARVDQSGRDVRVLDLLEAAEPRLGDLAESPAEVEAAIRNVVAQTWLSLDQNARGLETIRGGLDRLRAELPSDHSDHGEALYLLGTSLGAVGDYEAARTSLEEALTLRAAHTGPHSTESAHVLHALGVNEVRRGEPAAAAEHLRRAERIFRDQLGAPHQKTLTVVSDRVDTAHQLGDYDSVREDLDAALQKAREALGPDHHVTIGLTVSAANDARNRGASEEAEAAYLEALDRTRALYGDESPKARQLLGNLAVVRQDRGDFEGAEAAFVELVERHVAADDDPLQEVIARNNLASIQLRGGAAERALASYEALLQRADGLIPTDHWLHATFLRGRGASRTALGSFADAERDLLRSLEIYEATLGSDNPRTRTAVTALAEHYEAREMPEQAAPYRARLTVPGREPPR